MLPATDLVTIDLGFRAYEGRHRASASDERMKIATGYGKLQGIRRTAQWH